jgi:hypothetical protein
MADLERIGIFGPANPVIEAGSFSFTTLALNSTSRKVAGVFCAPESATITKIGYRVTSVTGVSAKYRFSLQSVDASGNPSGTVLGGGSPASGVDTPAGSNAWREVTLANSYAVTRGDVIAVVIEDDPATSGAGNDPDASNLATIAYATPALGIRGGVPVALANTGSWAKDTGAIPVMSFCSSTRSYGQPVLNESSVSVSSSGNRWARKLIFPADMGDTYKIIGLRALISPTVGGVIKAGLWSAGATLNSVSLDTDVIASSVYRYVTVYWSDAPATLTFGTTYYIGFERDTVNFSGIGVACQTAADVAALAGATGYCLSTYNGSAWSDTDTTMPMIFPVLSDITEPAGGAGGLLRSPGMGGGISG